MSDGVRGTLITADGVIADVVVRGNSFEILDGSLRKSTEASRLREALDRVDGKDDSALGVAFEAARRNPGEQIRLGDVEPVQKRGEKLTLDEAWERATRHPNKGPVILGE